MVAGQHVYDASPAEPGHDRNYSLGLCNYFSDHTGLSTMRVFTHPGHKRVCSISSHTRNQLSFVGYIERIEPEYLARAVDFTSDRNSFFEDLDVHFGCERDFIQRARDAAASRISETVNRGGAAISRRRSTHRVRQNVAMDKPVTSL